MSTHSSMPWEEFSADPRDPASAHLRASDGDRDVVLRVLADAYADGRLTREEYDERTEVVGRTRTLGELTPAVADLLPLTVSPQSSLMTPEELRTRALHVYQARRRSAMASTVTTTLLLTAIWFVLGGGNGFYWPVFFVVVSAAHLLRLILTRSDVIEEEQRRLEKKQRKSLPPPS